MMRKVRKLKKMCAEYCTIKKKVVSLQRKKVKIALI